MRSNERREELAREHTIARCLIRNADPARYGTLITELANQYAGQKDKYPKDIIAAKSLLVMYKTPTNTNATTSSQQQRQQQQTNTTNGNGDPLRDLTLAQRTAIAIAGTDSQFRPNVTCYGCGLPGHMAGECPTTTASPTTAVTLLQYAYVLAQATQAGLEHEIDPDWILLDSQSTISVFKNASMLTNIRNSGRVLRAITNGGHQDSVWWVNFPTSEKSGSTAHPSPTFCPLLKCARFAVSPWTHRLNPQ